ncbi:unnamed protein product [Lactuca virosa]|uniref:Uncharacterized protein n=1 Tax=Lactuca virosa TaxID=75947 RepID=A0AAU9PRW0_9ASTR|nr:unnamed protein product [Lactuca virosa]
MKFNGSYYVNYCEFLGGWDLGLFKRRRIRGLLLLAMIFAFFQLQILRRNEHAYQTCGRMLAINRILQQDSCRIQK